jgi:hypothetical protein
MRDEAREFLVNAVVFLGLAAAIIALGWKEPLSYRFMSEREIAAARATPPPPTPRPSAMEWHAKSRGTALDRAPYERHSGKVYYNKENIDQNELGSATETRSRKGLRNSE